MRSKILLLSACMFAAACAPVDDVKETGITRTRAISIARTHCPEYPGRYTFVDQAEWVPERGFWTVLLDDRSGDHGRVYKINRNGDIIGTRDINGERGDNDYGPGPYRRGWWY